MDKSKQNNYTHVKTKSFNNLGSERMEFAKNINKHFPPAGLPISLVHFRKKKSEGETIRLTSAYEGGWQTPY